MIEKYTKIKFNELDFDTKCVIIESLLTDEYFSGQEEIGFYCETDKSGNLLQKPNGIEEIENEKFEKLINKLTEKLFEIKTEIEFDTEY